jgi:hypothetical protein
MTKLHVPIAAAAADTAGAVHGAFAGTLRKNMYVPIERKKNEWIMVHR